MTAAARPAHGAMSGAGRFAAQAEEAPERCLGKKAARFGAGRGRLRVHSWGYGSKESGH